MERTRLEQEAQKPQSPFQNFLPPKSGISDTWTENGQFKAAKTPGSVFGENRDTERPHIDGFQNN